MTYSLQRPAAAAWYQWTPLGRAITFFLAATSIWCLLAEFYKLCSMRSFTFWVLIPATVVLIGLAVYDRFRGDRRLWQATGIGIIAGFAAAGSFGGFPLPVVVGAVGPPRAGGARAAL